MIVVVKKAFRRKRPGGKEETLFPNARITVENSETAQRLFDEGYIELVMTTRRRQSLEKIMDTHIRVVCQEIQADGIWHFSPDIEEMERAIHETYQAVLAGIKKLSDYRTAVERWRKAGTVH